MVITALSTRQPLQAPSTPVVAQQALSDLVNCHYLARLHRQTLCYSKSLDMLKYI